MIYNGCVHCRVHQSPDFHRTIVEDSWYRHTYIKLLPCVYCGTWYCNQEVSVWRRRIIHHNSLNLFLILFAEYKFSSLKRGKTICMCFTLQICWKFQLKILFAKYILTKSFVVLNVLWKIHFYCIFIWSWLYSFIYFRLQIYL